MSVIDTIKEQFKQGDYRTRLILANVIVYVAFLLIGIISFLSSGNEYLITSYIRPWLALPSDPLALITRPWTIITYMFLHADFWHLLWNMLILYFSGQIFLEYIGDRRLLTVFLYGGIAGGMTFFTIYNLSPAFTTGIPLVGASAGVVAVLIACATYVPKLPVRLFFVLQVPLWVVAAIAVVSYITGVTGANGGGNLAHLGGAVVGYLFVTQLRKGSDWSIGLFNFFNRVEGWFQPKPKLKKVYSNPKSKKSAPRSQSEQERIDAILDKILVGGYKSLTDEEREFLFKVGKK